MEYPKSKSFWNFIRRRKKQLALFVLVAGAILLFACWEAWLKDQVFPKNFGVVEQGKIYRSGKIAPRLLPGIIRKYHIKKIINLAGRKEPEDQTALRLGVEMSYFPLSGDGTGDINNYIETVAAIHFAVAENAPVLIHCTAGVHRTGGTIAVYKLLIENEDPAKIVREMESYGWQYNDDKKLLSYINSNMMTIASALKDRGVIKQIPNPLPQLKYQP